MQNNHEEIRAIVRTVLREELDNRHSPQFDLFLAWSELVRNLSTIIVVTLLVVSIALSYLFIVPSSYQASVKVLPISHDYLHNMNMDLLRVSPGTKQRLNRHNSMDSVLAAIKSREIQMNVYKKIILGHENDLIDENEFALFQRAISIHMNQKKPANGFTVRVKLPLAEEVVVQVVNELVNKARNKVISDYILRRDGAREHRISNITNKIKGAEKAYFNKMNHRLFLLDEAIGIAEKGGVHSPVLKDVGDDLYLRGTLLLKAEKESVVAKLAKKANLPELQRMQLQLDEIKGLVFDEGKYEVIARSYMVDSAEMVFPKFSSTLIASFLLGCLAGIGVVLLKCYWRNRKEPNSCIVVS